MDTSVSFPSRGIMFSSQLDDIVINTPLKAVDVVLYHNPAGADPVRLWSQTLWAYANKIPLAIADIVHSYVLSSVNADSAPSLLAMSLDVSDHYSVDAPVSSFAFDTVYAPVRSVADSADIWMRENFLSLSPTRRMPPKSNLSLYAYIAKAEKAVPVVAYTVRDNASGLLHSSHFSLKESQNLSRAFVKSVSINYSEILSHAASDIGLDSHSLDILSASVQIGGRHCVVFFDPALDGASPLHYLNSFLAHEVFWCINTSSVEHKFRKESAYIAKRLVQYGYPAQSQYASKSLPLTKHEVRMALDIADSPLVWKIMKSSDDSGPSVAIVPVVITDAEIKADQANADSMPVASLFWRFDSDVRLLEPASSYSRFTDNYQIPFY